MFLLLVVAFIFSSAYLNIFESVASDSAGHLIALLYSVYLFTYSYERLFTPPAVTLANEDIYKEGSLSLLLINLITLILCSRLRANRDSFNLLVMNVVYSPHLTPGSSTSDSDSAGNCSPAAKWSTIYYTSFYRWRRCGCRTTWTKVPSLCTFCGKRSASSIVFVSALSCSLRCCCSCTPGRRKLS